MVGVRPEGVNCKVKTALDLRFYFARNIDME
jgi:hypothetical protein